MLEQGTCALSLRPLLVTLLHGHPLAAMLNMLVVTLGNLRQRHGIVYMHSRVRWPCLPAK